MQIVTAFAAFARFCEKRNVLRNAYNPLERQIIQAIALAVFPAL